jgi:hypothetical protein
MYKLHPLQNDTEKLISLSRQSRIDFEKLISEENKPAAADGQGSEWG